MAEPHAQSGRSSTTALNIQESRKPFEGVAEFYSALQQEQDKRCCNPIFYVSSSAWNMDDIFARVMELNNIPKGPVFLQDYELSLESLLSFSHESHKLEQIQPIFARLPNLPFLLVGDSVQKAPEIYSSLLERYSERILGVLIRDVVPHNVWRSHELRAISEQVRAAGSHFCLFGKTVEAMQFAAKQGWILTVSAPVSV